MSRKAVQAIKAKFGDGVLRTTDFRGDDCAVVVPLIWREVAAFLRDDPAMQMNHFIDITAVDYPEREPDQPRFDVILIVRSQVNNLRVMVKTMVRDGEALPTLSNIWQGANWGEREVWDMFGIRFSEHPDLRRVLLYDEFVGHPLRKDYPIEKTQPLIEYRDADGIEKLAPFGKEEGQPWGRIDWLSRLHGGNLQVSPAIALQQGQRKALSESSEDLEEGSGKLS